MSRYNRFLWILVAVLGAVMIYQFFMMNRNKTPYKQTYYVSEYIFDNNSTAVSIHTVARFLFDKPEDLRKAMDRFKSLSNKDKLKAYNDIFAKLSKSLKKPIKALSYQSTMTAENTTTLQIEENGVVSGLVSSTDDHVKIAMGKAEMKLDKNSKVIFDLPKGSKLISALPTPTSVNGNKLIWKGPMDLEFPEVEYKK